MQFQKDIKACIDVLKNGGIILYPTDTIWGIGCDATNEQAVSKVFALKKRADTKSMIILLSNEDDIAKHVVNPDQKILTYISKTSQPVTAIYKYGKNLAAGLLGDNRSVGIRITKDVFCKTLIKQFDNPIVSTSANISGKPAASIFKEVSEEIKNGVDYIVQHRQNDFTISKPSLIIKLNDAGVVEVLRK